jgi:hypothetical protein
LGKKPVCCDAGKAFTGERRMILVSLWANLKIG